MNQRIIKIDAAGEILGRLATKVAVVLRGKDIPTYQPDRLPGVKVVITNAKLIKVTGRKLGSKFYYRHTGYPSGIKKYRLDELLEKHPDRVLRLAVRRMLAKNRMRDKLLKQLVIS